MKRRVKLIFNPHADRGRSWDIAASLHPIIERYGGASWSATEYPTHATTLASQTSREEYDVVVAIGGDGTVHEVVNGLMQLPPEKRPMLGALPIGSGNDFCANLGVAFEPERAMERIFTAGSKSVDVGEIVDVSGRSEFFNNTLGIGFDANVLLYTYQVTRLYGFSMYLYAVLRTIMRNHVAPRMSITLDGETIERDVLMLVMCNGAREGGGFYVAPDAKLDDGVLNYAMISYVSRLTMFRLVPEVMNGTHAKFKQVSLGEFKELKLKSEIPVPIHLDGEVYAGFTSDVKEFEVRIHPSALETVV
jgi:diacylglycerol kinase (ATP)